MPSKRVIKQKQKQKQTTIVNINLAKAKARAKSSAKKSGGKGSVMMLPPPIYTSPIDRLTPAMYGAQGQQIQQKSMEEVLRNFLSNQQKQNAPVSTPNTLGTAPRSALSSLSSYGSTNATANSSTSSNSLTDYGSSNSSSLNSLRYFPNQHSDSSLGSLSSDNSLRTKTPSTSIYSTIGSSIDAWNSDNVSELSDRTYFSKPMSTESQYDRALASPFSTDSSFSTDSIFSKDSLVPTPFQREEKTYLKASEPDDNINVPKFSQNEARISQGNIYESARRPERRPPVIIPNEDESSVESYKPQNPLIRQVSNESSVNPFPEYKPQNPLIRQVSNESSENPFPEKMYNKIMEI
jgi:hypothetical protein